MARRAEKLRLIHPTRSKGECICQLVLPKTTGPTGVEMEAMTAVSVAALTIYDMCKAVDKAMTITGIKLVSKTKSAALCES